MVTSVPAVTIVAADHSLRRAAPNGIEASRVIKILPALVPGPWTPGTTRPDGGSQSVYVLRTRMVQTSERISSVASKDTVNAPPRCRTKPANPSTSGPPTPPPTAAATAPPVRLPQAPRPPQPARRRRSCGQAYHRGDARDLPAEGLQ